MNNLSYRALRASSLKFLTSALVIICASAAAVVVVVCQQRANAPVQAGEGQGDAEPLVFSVTVTNKNGDFVTRLDKSDFVVLDDKAPQELTYFKGQDEPLSVAIVLDVSAYMFKPVQRDLMKALFDGALIQRFIRQSNPANNYLLIGFSQRPQLMVDWTSDAAEIDAALRKTGEVTPKGGEAALYDACYLGVEKLSHAANAKRVLLLITDGYDQGSHYKPEELRKLLGQSNVLLYSIGLSGALDATTEIGLIHGQRIIDGFATITGGVGIFPARPQDVPKAFDMIAQELRNQYSIGFSPASKPGKTGWRKVKIKLASDARRELQSLQVRSREEYYANATRR